MTTTSDPQADEPTRVRIHTSLTERPLFAGVDMEVLMVCGFLIWGSFLMFKLTVPFWIMLGFCAVLVQAMRMANHRDPFFLPILFRSLTYRGRYAPQSSPTELTIARPTIPAQPLPS